MIEWLLAISILAIIVGFYWIYDIYKLNKLADCLVGHQVEQERLEHQIHEKPFRIFLVRHGLSSGNKSLALYNSVPDPLIPLEPEGREMAVKAGNALREKFLELYPPSKGFRPRIAMRVSPFLRTRETALGLLKGMGEVASWVAFVKETPLLVEQDWGLFEGTGREKRKNRYQDEHLWLTMMKGTHQGPYWARLPCGESFFDVCQRMQILFPSIERDREGLRGYRKRSGSTDAVIVVSHGLTIRAFVASWCNLDVEWFSRSSNPPNCSIRMIETTNESTDVGYIFGGFDEENHEHPLDVNELNSSENWNVPSTVDEWLAFMKIQVNQGDSRPPSQRSRSSRMSALSPYPQKIDEATRLSLPVPKFGLSP
eukprot:c10138_g1_i2.p1 GENE.c10138_g1_i2~~c10138_g1_i2.p1  ORF type:complete len:369 (+),score=167.32 c10138_g1_i2:93-1199(+)